MHEMPRLSEIPEIMNLIAGYVDSRDFVACARVSKYWYQIFILLLWNNITFCKERHVPTESTLSKNAHLISSLKIKGGMPFYVSNIRYPSLRTLFITGTSANIHVFSSPLLSNNPSIEDLSIQCNVQVPDYLELCNCLSNLQCLTRLYMAGHNLPSKSADAFWTTICRLESARLINIAYPDYQFTHPITPSKLKSLEVGGRNDQNQLGFVKRCTEIEHLQWVAPFGGNKLAINMSGALWPKLCRLELLYLSLLNDQQQRIISAIPRLTTFSSDRSIWGTESFNALSLHFHSLEVLDVLGSSSFTSEMVHTVMCSCPNLKRLAAVMILGTDILNNNQIDSIKQQSQEWVCTQITTLKLHFNLLGLDSQVPIFEKLSRLTQLSVLHFGRSNTTLDCPSISLSLDDGLDILSPLKFLTSVRTDGKYYKMTTADMSWVSKHWKRLDAIQDASNIDTELIQMFFRGLLINI